MIMRKRAFQWCSAREMSKLVVRLGRPNEIHRTVSRSQQSTMNTAYFRHHANTETIELTFQYKNVAFGIDRIFNFQRSLTEPVETTFGRIRTNFEKEFRKKGGDGGKKKKKSTCEAVENEQCRAVDVNIQLLKDGQPIVKDMTWANLFAADGDAKGFVLKVLEQDYIATYNHPYIGQFALPTIIMVGYHCYPAKCEVFFAKREDCCFEWFRGKAEDESSDAAIVWQKCGQSFFYNVKEADVRHKIKLICTPQNGSIRGRPIELISKVSVDAGPGFCAFEQKQLFTPNRLPADERQFRVMSYNLLADYYCDSDYSRIELFPYCPPFALAIDYRKQLFLREIIGYHSDICCLQEVDAKIYDLDLKMCLGYHDYDGTMQKKGDTAEGLATFYHRSKFSLHAKYGMNLSEHLKKQPYFSELFAKIADNEKLCERMLSLSTAIQVTVLKSLRENKYLIVANTHLYFHPDADHIRVLQIAFFMLYVQHVHQKTIEELNLCAEQTAIIFCGDFNSVPECGIYKLMTEKFVPEDFIDFRSNAEETVTNVSLQQPYDMGSAYNNPKYTNFTTGFAACLDYIFYETNKFRVVQAVPLPDEEELKQLVAIPSLVFPSDHISLVADLEWIQ